MLARFLCLTAALSASALGISADKAVEDLLSKMRATYQSFNTAHIVVKTTARRFGSQSVTTDLIYQRERKLFVKVYNLPSLKGKVWKFVSDGVDVSLSDLGGNEQRTKFDLDFIPVPINLEAMALWDWKRQLSTTPGSNMEKSRFKLVTGASWNGKTWTVLEETAVGQGVFVRYFIQPSSGLIYRVQVFDLGESQQRLETVVVKLEKNIRVDAKIFKLKPVVNQPRKIE